MILEGVGVLCRYLRLQKMFHKSKNIFILLWRWWNKWLSFLFLSTECGFVLRYIVLNLIEKLQENVTQRCFLTHATIASMQFNFLTIRLGILHSCHVRIPDCQLCQESQVESFTFSFLGLLLGNMYFVPPIFEWPPKVKSY